MELFDPTRQQLPEATDLIPYKDVSEPDVTKQIKYDTLRKVVNAGFEIVANGSNNALVVRDPSGNIVGFADVKTPTPETLANLVPVGSFSSFTATFGAHPNDNTTINFTATAVAGAEYELFIRQTDYESWYGYSRGSATQEVSIPGGSYQIALQVTVAGESGPISMATRVTQSGYEPTTGITVSVSQLPSGQVEWVASGGGAWSAIKVYARKVGTTQYEYVGQASIGGGSSAVLVATLSSGEWEWVVVEYSFANYIRSGSYTTGTFEVMSALALCNDTDRRLGVIGRNASKLSGFYRAVDVAAWSQVAITPVMQDGILVADMGARGSTESRVLHTAASTGTLIGCMGCNQVGNDHPVNGIAMIDASGNGVGLGAYSNGPAYWLFTISNFAYLGTLTFKQQATVMDAPNLGCARIWFKLRRSGTTYYGAYSNDGIVWSDEISGTVAGTPTRVAVGQYKRINGAFQTDSSKLTVHFMSAQ